MTVSQKIRVGVNGYGVIGKRVALAVGRQTDMELTGVADIIADWRLRLAARQGIPLYAATTENLRAMEAANLQLEGGLDELIAACDVLVDCTPKGVGARNAETYGAQNRPFVLQGGEAHPVAGHSFVAEANYLEAVGSAATRVVSCNTTSIVRTLSALKRAGLLRRARGTLLRRATDPWESDRGGIMNTLVPEPDIPSHQGPDARTVDPDLDVVTMAVKVPETLGHLHYWAVQMTREASKDEVLEAFGSSSRIAPIRTADGLGALNVVKEMMADLGRPHGDLYEVALWTDMLRVQGDELFYAYMVDNQAIVIPETIDAIRALAGRTRNGAASIQQTNASLGIGTFDFVHAAASRAMKRSGSIGAGNDGE